MIYRLSKDPFHPLNSLVNYNTKKFDPIVSNWIRWALLPKFSDGNVSVTINRKIVAFFRYDYNSFNGILHAAGTFVIPELRKHGVGEKMWSLVIKTLKPRNILVTTITKAGSAFTEKLREKYPKIRITKY